MSEESLKLNIPIRNDLIKEFLAKRLDLNHIEDILEKIDSDDLYVCNLIVRRIKLADNLLTDEPFTHVNRGIGMFEESALRLHLLLSCIEVVGRLVGKSKYLDFGSWLNAKKEPYKSEKASIKILDEDGSENIAKVYYEAYLKLHGVKIQFYSFFHHALTAEDKSKLLTSCWVLKQKPLPHIYHLQHINFTKEYNNKEFQMLKENKKIWDALETETKLTWIGEALYSVRNMYTHSLVPYTSVKDKPSPPFVVAQRNEYRKRDNNIYIHDRGDTIFVWERHIAISFARQPTTKYVQDLIEVGLSNYLNDKYLKP